MNSGQHNTSRRGLVKRLLQLFILCLVAWGVWHSIRRSTSELAVQQSRLREQAEQLLEQAQASNSPEELADLQARAQKLRRKAQEFWKPALSWLWAAGGLYALGMLAPCMFWRRCLRELDQADHLLDVCWAYFYGNLGKYLPGKAMVIVLRLNALAEHQVKKTATVLTIFMETLTLMSVGGAVAAVCLIILQLDWRLTLLAVGLLFSTLAPASPPVMRFLLPRLQKGVDPQQLSHWTDRLSWRLFFQGWGMLTLGWVLNGLSLMMVLKGLPSADLQSADLPSADLQSADLQSMGWFVLLISSCGACALAVVLGFVSLVPGGAGVREFVILAVLTPVVGATAALCSAVWLRIVWLCTELAMVGLLAVIRWSLSASKSRNSPVSTAHSN